MDIGGAIEMIIKETFTPNIWIAEYNSGEWKIVKTEWVLEELLK